jgi:hypothetical protein
MTALGRLDYGVHLGVHRAHTMVLYQQTAHILAMLIAGDRSIVSCGDNILIFNQNSTAMHARASGAFRSQHRQFQKVFVPVRSLSHNIITLPYEKNPSQ